MFYGGPIVAGNARSGFFHALVAIHTMTIPLSNFIELVFR